MQSSRLIDPFDQIMVSTSQPCTDLPFETKRSGTWLPEFVFHHTSLMYFLAFKGKLCFYCKNENYACSVLCKKWDESNERNYCLLGNGNHHLATVVIAPFLCALLSLSYHLSKLALIFPFCLSFQPLIIWLNPLCIQMIPCPLTFTCHFPI